jgi:hypothetical protein
MMIAKLTEGINLASLTSAELHDLWDAQRAADHERRVEAAKKGVETRRRNRAAKQAASL